MHDKEGDGWGERRDGVREERRNETGTEKMSKKHRGGRKVEKKQEKEKRGGGEERENGRREGNDFLDV